MQIANTDQEYLTRDSLSQWMLVQSRVGPHRGQKQLPHPFRQLPPPGQGACWDEGATVDGPMKSPSSAKHVTWSVVPSAALTSIG